MMSLRETDRGPGAPRPLPARPVKCARRFASCAALSAAPPEAMEGDPLDDAALQSALAEIRERSQVVQAVVHADDRGPGRHARSGRPGAPCPCRVSKLALWHPAWPAIMPAAQERGSGAGETAASSSAAQPSSRRPWLIAALHPWRRWRRCNHIPPGHGRARRNRQCDFDLGVARRCRDGTRLARRSRARSPSCNADYNTAVDRRAVDRPHRPARPSRRAYARQRRRLAVAIAGVSNQRATLAQGRGRPAERARRAVRRPGHQRALPRRVSLRPRAISNALANCWSAACRRTATWTRRAPKPTAPPRNFAFGAGSRRTYRSPRSLRAKQGLACGKGAARIGVGASAHSRGRARTGAYRPRTHVYSLARRRHRHRPRCVNRPDRERQSQRAGVVHHRPGFANHAGRDRGR